MSYDVGRVISDERARQGLSIEALARSAGVSTNTVQRAQRGEATEVKVRRILLALGVDTAVLSRSDDASPEQRTETVRARTVTDELVTILGLPDDVLAGLAPEDRAEIDAEVRLTILRTARERRGRTT